MKLVPKICALFLLIAVVAPLQARVIENSRNELPFSFYNICTFEQFSGFLLIHTVLREHEDGAGGYHYGFHYQPQGGVLVGEDSGEIYRTTGVTREGGNIGVSGLPFEFTFVNHANFIIPGSDTTKLHQTIHVTVNELGEVTSEVLNARVECH